MKNLKNLTQSETLIIMKAVLERCKYSKEKGYYFFICNEIEKELIKNYGYNRVVIHSDIDIYNFVKTNANLLYFITIQNDRDNSALWFCEETTERLNFLTLLIKYLETND